MLAAMIDADSRFVSYAPDYLLTPNHKISKKDAQDAQIVIYQYEQFLRNAKGMANYNGVWRQYPELFKGAHIWSESWVNVPMFMAHGNDLSIEWQNQPGAVLKMLEKFAGYSYFQANFNELRPKIRVMMASWFFVQKMELRQSDQQDDLLIRERKTYQSLLDSYVKVRKSQDEHLAFLDRIKLSSQVVILNDLDGNEIPKNDEQSET